jgi:hypothetical protein
MGTQINGAQAIYGRPVQDLLTVPDKLVAECAVRPCMRDERGDQSFQVGGHAMRERANGRVTRSPDYHMTVIS